MTNQAKPATSTPAGHGSADPAEIAKFSALADTWWALEGPFRPLHKFNPVRIEALKQRFAAHFSRDAALERPFEGLTLLDIGCGGGLISEPMARLGFAVTGIDASEKNVKIAANHAERMRLPIVYRCAKPEDLDAEAQSFDVVLALEVVEHVADRGLFMNSAIKPLRKGGLIALATLNRTVKSLLMAKIGAEYVVRWLPAGTHDWRAFVKPSELAHDLRNAGTLPPVFAGLTYNPLRDAWSESADLSVNYMAFAVKP